MTTAATEVPKRPVNVDRFIDIVTVVMISCAALMTAWCSYQSSKWSGVQGKVFAIASAARVRASTMRERGSVRTAVDVGLFVHYVNARFMEHSPLADFLHQRFPPELRRSMDDWLATEPFTNPSAPESPFVMSSFELEANKEADRFEAEATEAYERGIAANDHATDFVLVTVLFASVSFLAGVGGKLRAPFHLAVVLIGLVILLGAIAILSRLPTAPVGGLAANLHW
ncbi:MAG: hypothetical protein JST54_11780 [Deltaproteobacteria bacterium]|nr:hypothetical protein [Deltaproteobacteria bacterium]